MSDVTTRALIALGLEFVFFATAFGWRSLLLWRTTGSTGFVRPHRDAGVREMAGPVAFVGALTLLVAAPFAALGGIPTIAALDSAAVGAAGVLCGLFGIATTIAAQISMGASWRIGVDPDERTELVTTGIFARVRNPVFSAMILASIGLVLLVANLVGVGALLLLVIGVVVQVTWVEEPYLQRTHGREFENYRQRTGRFLPRLRHGENRDRYGKASCPNDKYS